MFSKDAHLIYFTDPLADTLEKGTRIFANLERVVRNVSIGKVVDVTGFARYDTRGWRVSEGGYHVSGPVVNNPNTLWNGWHFGLRDGDDTVVLGRYAGTHGARAILNSARYSDQRKLPGEAVAPFLADTWFKAASWADELFPHPTDSDALVAAKLRLAEQRWNQRRAKVTLLAEGQSRGYAELEELVEEGDLPTPVFGAVYNGDVLIPTGRAPRREDRTVATQERIDRVQAKLGTNVDPSNAYLSLRVEIPLPDISEEGVEGLSKVTPYVIANNLYSVTGDSELKPAAYTLVPVLRSTTTAA